MRALGWLAGRAAHLCSRPQFQGAHPCLPAHPHTPPRAAGKQQSFLRWWASARKDEHLIASVQGVLLGNMAKSAYVQAVAERAEPGQPQGPDTAGWRYKCGAAAAAAAALLAEKGWDK